jgi:hypothetical protein
VPPPRELRVLAAEKGAPLIQTALRGLELAQLKVVTPIVLNEMIADGSASTFDVVVTRDVSLEELPRGRYLAFGGEISVPALRRYAEGEGQMMLVAKEDHPVMRFVRFEEIVATKGNAVVPTNGAEVLLEGSFWPAILHYRGEGRSIVYVAFDPIDSNWPYLRSFPFFVYNAVDFLGRSGDVLATTPLDVGDAIVGTATVGATSVEIVEPDGAKHSVIIDTNGRFTWGPIRLSGVHRIERNDGVSRIVAVNSPPEESLLSSSEDFEIGSAKVKSTATRTSSYIQLWPWAIGCVLLVLLAEWRLYQRKVSGPKQHLTDAFGLRK